MVKNQLLWMKKILFPGIEKIQENIQFPRMQFPEKIQFLGMQFPEKIQFPGMQFPEKIQFSRIEFLRNVENQKVLWLPRKVTEVTLGSGTFGVVVKGVYLGTEVAIKMIKMDDDMNLKTHLEVQIMRQLRHPNIITLMGISSNKSELLIVMNLVNGFNVDQVIFKQALPLDTNTVRSIAVQITKALTYMHGRSPRVIHHDIKPSNIMVTGSHHVFVCDLGLAKLQNHLATIKTSKGCGAGTVPYKAPEMFYDGKRSTPADIYSFGCVLIELTTSRRVWVVAYVDRIIAMVRENHTGVFEASQILEYIFDAFDEEVVEGGVEGGVDEEVEGGVDEEVEGGVDEEVEGGVDEEVEGGVDEEVEGGVDEEVEGGVDEEVEGGVDEEVEGGVDEEVEGGVDEEVEGGVDEEVEGGVDEEVEGGVDEEVEGGVDEEVEGGGG
ncbi:hypothetical protein EMCRGX_G002788 [Ephydatia muelleri]